MGSLVGLDGLNNDQREACRLEMVGLGNGEIAKRLGVNPSTVSGWRNNPLYIEHLDSLHRKADAACLRKAARVRDRALAVVMKGIDRLGVVLDDDDLGAHESATATRAAMDSYRTLAAQTGISESSTVQVKAEVNPKDLVNAAIAQLKG